MNLQIKLAKYLDLKKQYEDPACEEEIEKKVQEYRQCLISEHISNLAKINHYIELLIELIKEEVNEETNSIVESVEVDEDKEDEVVVAVDTNDSDLADPDNN